MTGKTTEKRNSQPEHDVLAVQSELPEVVLAEVARDAGNRLKLFLRDPRVPEGGE